MSANKETACAANSIICETQSKIQVNDEIVLSEQMPDIKRIVKSNAYPLVESVVAGDKKAEIKGKVIFDVLYMPEGSMTLRNVRGSASFSKIAEADCIQQSDRVVYAEKVNFLNVKAVDERRIELICGICVDMRFEEDMPLDCETVDGAEIKSKTEVFCNFSGYGEKSFDVAEDIAIPASMPQAQVMLAQSVLPCVTDKKPLKDKVVIKGAVKVKSLYASDIETGKIEVVESSIPFTTVLDVEGASEESSCRVRVKIENYEYSLYENSDGENRIIGTTISLFANCFAYTCMQQNIVTDAFYPDGSCELETESGMIQRSCSDIRIDLPVSSAVEFADEISEVVMSDAEAVTVGYEVNDKTAKIMGDLNYSLIVKYQSGKVDQVLQTAPFAAEAAVDCDCVRHFVDPEAEVESFSVVLTSEKTAEIRATVDIEADVSCMERIDYVKNIKINEGEVLRNPYLTAYYPTEQEELWDVAKRYGKSRAEILEKNGGSIEGKRMILV